MSGRYSTLCLPRHLNLFSQALLRLLIQRPSRFRSQTQGSSLERRRGKTCVGRRGGRWEGDVPYWAAGVRVPSVLLSASSAEFTTDLVPVLSMTKLADASTSIEGGGSCFADMLMPGESIAFAEFFIPWLVPYEHFIPGTTRPGGFAGED
ncbi:hypothetical protein B0H14DRAFT_2824445 [Mycena olivaceomarginata]|nr:hypothetical protein B0H14DRAFT_2824445 [Mycena olivaceomarginata]